MGLGYDIGINMGSALVGALVGASWTRARKEYEYRFHHAFWNFLERPTIFVVGELQTSVLLDLNSEAVRNIVGGKGENESLMRSIIDHVDNQEVSGLIGRGDFDAIVSMIVKLTSLRPPTHPRVLHPSQVGELRTQNLVLIGGSDVNSLTAAMAPRMGCQLKAMTNDHGRNVIRDLRLGTEYPVTKLRQPGQGGEITTVDYGVLARGRNPENPRSEVLVIAGAHGLGTLAAAEVSLSDTYQKRLCSDLKDYTGSMECLVSYEHVDGGPANGRTTVELEFSRRIHPEVVNH